MTDATEETGPGGGSGATVGGQPRRLVVVGQGYVGLPLALRAVEVGYDVVGIDNDRGRVEHLRDGESYVEDIGADRLAAALATGRYLPTTSYAESAGFDVCIISVPTPLREGSPDLSFMEAAAEGVAAYLRPGATVVLESTTYPGTTEELIGPLLEAGSGLKAGPDFHLGYSPERIDPGNTRWTLESTPKVVSGIDGASLAAVKGFYDDIVETTVPLTSTRAAEMTKLLENTFRHVNIALVNELAMFAGDLGVDIWEAIDAASTKPFGYLRFTPGPGVGGHCLPVDPSYLSWRVKRTAGRSFRFVELANDVNDHMPDYVVSRVAAALNRERKAVHGSRILLLGLAYKPNTSDARESPAMRVAQLLVGMQADVVAVDPYVVPALRPLPVPLVELTADELDRSDAVIVLTDHDSLDYDLVMEHASYILDTRRRCRGGAVEHL